MIPIEKVFVPPIVTGFPHHSHHTNLVKLYSHDRGLSPIPEGQNTVLLPAVRIFGAEVERVIPSGGELPSQIERVVRQIEATGLEEEGLFRLSPDATQVEQIRVAMDRGISQSPFW